MNGKETALLSAYTKDERLREFAAALVKEGWDILASSGTKKFLDGHDIPSTDVADLVGEPILGHRVVTLDRKIYAGILARRGNPDDMAELERIGAPLIRLVYVSLYPLAEELTNPAMNFDSVVEKTDIGGPTLLRAAAKSGGYVVSSPEQFETVIDFIKSSPLTTPTGIVATRRFISTLAAAAEDMVSAYAALSAKFHQSVADGEFPHQWRRT